VEGGGDGPFFCAARLFLVDPGSEEGVEDGVVAAPPPFFPAERLGVECAEDMMPLEREGRLACFSGGELLLTAGASASPFLHVGEILIEG